MGATSQFRLQETGQMKTNMYGEGKEVLRQYIKNKRGSEGLDEVPEDLFAKKPKQIMSEEEFMCVVERRKRNKEAAERSRKKKKEEFEKLQSENDQLNQDKCELVAMVQKLKDDIESFAKENGVLRSSYEHLKRWIGKRSMELGLTKYLQEDGKNKESGREDLPVFPLTQSPPLPCAPEAEEKRTGADSRSSSPKSGSLPEECRLDWSQPLSRSQFCTPWLVEPAVKKKPSSEICYEAPQTFAPRTAKLPENPPVVVAKGQQVVYLPKDAIIVIQGDEQAVTAGTPDPRQVVLPNPGIAAEAPVTQNMGVTQVGTNKASPNGTMMTHLAASESDKETGETMVSNNAGMDPATATAIESLLKLGYKIQVTEAPPCRSQSA